MKKKVNSRPKLKSYLHRPKLIIALLFMLAFGSVGGYMIGHSHAGTGSCTLTVLGPGSYGSCVYKWQEVYNDWEINRTGLTSSDIGTDSSYGTETYKATKNFQTVRGLTVDGYVGQQTWGSMCKYIKDHNLSYWEIGCYNPAFVNSWD